MAPSVKRSLSTPNVQAVAMSEHPGIPYSTDKRRNKLGYHRTSVACGHCRRRKIRCLIEKSDLVGRCSNCIRLKKDCNFFPVESTDRRPRSPSKPDILNHDVGSAASSPGLGQGQMLENVQYPASLPVTPTCDPSIANFEDNYRPDGTPGLLPRIPISQSASVSRRPSIAHMNPGSLSIKPEQAFPRSPWEVIPQQETPNLFDQHGSFEDPSTTYWRLNSPSIGGGPYPQHSLHSMNSMASLTTPESLDSYDGGIYSQRPSRMGSMDQGTGGVFGYPTTHSPEATDFGIAPDLRSASASTASLTASISEASQYGAPGEPGYGQHYSMTQWVDQTPNGIPFDPETTVKEEDRAVDQYLYSAEEGYLMNRDFLHFVYPGQQARLVAKPDQE